MQESRKESHHPLRWRESHRALAQARLMSVYTQWRSDWGLNAVAKPEGSLQKVPAELNDLQVRRCLAVELFGTAPADALPAAEGGTAAGIAQQVVREAWDDWLTRLARALNTTANSAANGLQQYRAARVDNSSAFWDGGVEISFPWRDGHWSLRIGPDAVAHVLGADYESTPAELDAAHMPVVAVESALAGKAMKIQVRFDPLQLSLGQLQDLQVGDVIALKRQADEPVPLAFAVGSELARPFCMAWLGQRHGQLAVELYEPELR